MKRFGEKIKLLREERRMTTRQLGEALGVNGSHVSNMEGGVKKPSVELLIALASYFGVTTDQLLRDELEV
jgi:transcriptional regulator with XRE-family HTH domain